MRRIATLLIVLVSIGLVLCQGLALSDSLGSGQDESRTGVLVFGTHGYMTENGRAWNQLDTQSKIMYLVGVEDGIKLLALETPPETKPKVRSTVDSLMISGFRFLDLVKQIDEFYKDSANIRIPVIEAYQFTLKKLHGSTRQELEDQMAALRREYNH